MQLIILAAGTGSRLGGLTKKIPKSLIDNEITGSNVALVYQNGKKIYHEVVQSGKDGDKGINVDTIFPIWSMDG